MKSFLSFLFLLSIFLGASPSAAQEISQPVLKLVDIENSSTRQIEIDAEQQVSGFNLYREGRYLSTYTSPVIPVNAEAGNYCVVSFLHLEHTTLYSQCSTSVSVPVGLQQAEESLAVDESHTDGSDVDEPVEPGNVRASVYSGSAAEVFWEADAKAESYEIFRGGTLLASGDARSYFDDELEAGNTYRYEVVAIARSGARSLPVSVELQTARNHVMQSPQSGGSQSGGLPFDELQSGHSKALNLRSVFYSPAVAEIFWDSAATTALPVTYQLLRDGAEVSNSEGRSYFEPVLALGREYSYELRVLDANAITLAAETIAVRYDAEDRPLPGLAPTGSDQSASDAIADFSLHIAEGQWQLLEGSINTLHIPVILERRNAHEARVSLSIEALQTVRGAAVDVSFDRTEFFSNAGRSAVDLALSLQVSAQPLERHERSFRVTANDGRNQYSTEFSVVIEPVSVPDVYLLAGQSNMVGYSELGLKEVFSGGLDEKNSRVLQLNVTSNNLSFYGSGSAFSEESVIAAWPRLIVAEDPMHESLYPGASSRGGTFVGPGLSFAKAALRDTGNIVLVPTAWSGTGFCRSDISGELAWNAAVRPTSVFGGTSLLERSLARLNLALSESGGVFRGILWHQGEADSNNQVCADEYAQNLRAMVERLRSEARIDLRGEQARHANANIPFIVATMSRGNDSRGQHQWFGPIKNQVDAVHRGISELIPYSAFVNADDLVPPAYACGVGSCVHFGAASYREIGRRYFQALQGIWSNQ